MTKVDESEATPSLDVLLSDMFGFLETSENPIVKINTLGGLLPFLRSSAHVDHLEQHYLKKSVLALKEQLDSSYVVTKLALQCLIALTSSKEVSEDLNDDVPLDDVPTGGANYEFIKEMIKQGIVDKMMTMLITAEITSKTDEGKHQLDIMALCAILLNNVTTTTYGARKLLQLKCVEDTLNDVAEKEEDIEASEEDEDDQDEEEEKDGFHAGYYVYKLVDWFRTRPEDKFTSWIPNILTNVTNISDGRDLMLKKDQESVLGSDHFLLSDLVGTNYHNSILTHSSAVKRSGALKTVRNCLFEKEEHFRIIHETPLLDIVLTRLSSKQQDEIEKVDSLRNLLSEVVLIMTASKTGTEALTTETSYQALERAEENAHKAGSESDKKIISNVSIIMDRVKRRIAERSGVQFGEGEFVRLETIEDDEEEEEETPMQSILPPSDDSVDSDRVSFPNK
ncbi:HGH1-like protein [Acrasis kona]|uniref:HGH1-like protein n=1 Tax=Acrasis kona TaxID=1008807 RepID=A0AAW2ZLS8_9EUKA